MHYAISDIHGCYAQYLAMLRILSFRESDTLYVLGDCVDRGPAPMALLIDMMSRPNVIPIMGNHELLTLFLLRQLTEKITVSSIESVLNMEMVSLLSDWLADGGETTWRDFQKLSIEQRTLVADYLGEFSLYEECTACGQSYLMLHGGLEPFVPERPVEEYDLATILLSRPNYDKPYFSDKFTVTGHTPTLLEPGNKGSVIRKNNHIAIDCGCVFGGNLAAFCLETQEEFYVRGISGSS